MGIEQTFKQMKERIKPAVLAPSFQNGVILRSWCEQNGIDPNGATVDQLVQGVTAKVEKLEWLTKPATLKKFDETGIRNQTTAKHDQDAFAEKAKKAEADKEYQKAQDAALRQINLLIDGIQFKDASGTRIAYGKTEAAKDVCRKHLANAQAGKRKRDLTVVAREIQKYINDEYEKAEKATERV
jgi:hypothetical protein